MNRGASGGVVSDFDVRPPRVLVQAADVPPVCPHHAVFAETGNSLGVLYAEVQPRAQVRADVGYHAARPLVMLRLADAGCRRCAKSSNRPVAPERRAY